MHLSLKVLRGMANSEDLIKLLLQEMSELGVHCLYVAFFQKLFCVRNFRTFTVIHIFLKTLSNNALICVYTVVTLVTTTAFVPKKVAIKMNLLLQRILNGQDDM